MTEVSIDNNQDQGSFITGFTVGILAGAVGYYLFGTKKGGKLLATLKDEWQAAQQELSNHDPNGSPEQASTNVLESVRSWIDRLSQAVGAIQTSSSRHPKHGSYKDKDTRAKKVIKKFKGV